MYISYPVHISREESQHLEVVTGASGVQCRAHLCSEFDASPSNMRLSQKKIIKKDYVYVYMYKLCVCGMCIHTYPHIYIYI